MRFLLGTPLKPCSLGPNLYCNSTHTAMTPETAEKSRCQNSSTVHSDVTDFCILFSRCCHNRHRHAIIIIMGLCCMLLLKCIKISLPSFFYELCLGLSLQQQCITNYQLKTFLGIYIVRQRHDLSFDLINIVMWWRWWCVVRSMVSSSDSLKLL